jgi:glycerol kinase
MNPVSVVDQGTTLTKGLVLDAGSRVRTVSELAHRQIYPHAGWVEHDPLELLENVRKAAAASCAAAASAPAAFGLANQGETVIAWDARDGAPVYNAIVWQDDRTRPMIERLKAAGAEALTLERAGLPLDPYFSASKLHWLIENAPGAERLLARNRLRLGTSDAFFLDRLSGVYATDVTTASRTSLMDLRRRRWDPELCELFGIPLEALPEIRPTTGHVGVLREVNDVALTASVVDQQAALFGHGCLRSGATKITFGTGAFALANCGSDPVSAPENGILSTLAWQLQGAAPVYALDGGIYNAASAVEWLRGVGLAVNYAELDAFDGAPAITRGLAFVPALSGLGCPYWDRSAAGLWVGLGLDTTRADLCRSVLEGIALRASQLLERFRGIAGRPAMLPADGGLTNNDYFCQFLADATGLEVVLPAVSEITGFGAGRLALLGAGVADTPDGLPPAPAPRRRFHPQRDMTEERTRFDAAVARARHWR